MIDHCIAALRYENEDKLLKVYLTDCFKSIHDAVLVLGGVNSDIPRWIELHEEEPKKQKSSAEIISSIKDKLMKMGGRTDGIDAV